MGQKRLTLVAWWVLLGGWLLLLSLPALGDREREKVHVEDVDAERVQVTWTGDAEGVAFVEFALVNANDEAVAQVKRERPPFTATLKRSGNADTARVYVVYADDVKFITLVPLAGQGEKQETADRTDTAVAGSLPTTNAEETLTVALTPWQPKFFCFFVNGSERVVNANTGRVFERVHEDEPQAGQYRVDSPARFRFASEDQGATVTVRYRYQPRRIAMLPVHNETTLSDPGTTLAATLREALEQHGYDLVPEARVREAARALRIFVSGDLSAEMMRTLGERLGCHDIVAARVRGLFRFMGADDHDHVGMEINLRIFDARTGRKVWEHSSQAAKHVKLGGLLESRKKARQRAIEASVKTGLAEYFGDR